MLPHLPDGCIFKSSMTWLATAADHPKCLCCPRPLLEQSSENIPQDRNCPCPHLSNTTHLSLIQLLAVLAGCWTNPPQVIIMETSGEPHQQGAECKAKNPAGMWEPVLWAAPRRRFKLGRGRGPVLVIAEQPPSAWPWGFSYWAQGRQGTVAERGGEQGS